MGRMEPPNVDFKSRVMPPRMCFCSKVFLPFVQREENGRLGSFCRVLGVGRFTTRLGTFLAATLSVVLLQPVAVGLLNLIGPRPRSAPPSWESTPEPSLVNHAEFSPRSLLLCHSCPAVRRWPAGLAGPARSLRVVMSLRL